LTIAADGTRTLRFTDVTRESHIVTLGNGMGVAAGDFDNDGWVDLYLTKFDTPNQLLRNNGDGTFTDHSKSSGTDHHSWSVSASFVDVNRDGWLDLFVGNYVRYALVGSTPGFMRQERSTTARRMRCDTRASDAFRSLPSPA
jgi:hypothetical protein